MNGVRTLLAMLLVLCPPTLHTGRLRRSREFVVRPRANRRGAEAAPKVHEALSTLDEKFAEIFRGHPFYKAPDLAPMLRRLVARTHITT